MKGKWSTWKCVATFSWSVVTHFPKWGQWAQFSSIQYLHTTDYDMGGGILFCIVFIVHIFQTCFNNDTLFYFFHLKVQSLIVWQRNPMRIDWRGPSPVFRLTMRPPPGSSVRVMETKHHLDQRRWAPATVCEVVTYIWNFVFQNQDRSKKPLGMKLKTSYSKFLLYKLKFCKIRCP